MSSSTVGGRASTQRSNADEQRPALGVVQNTVCDDRPARNAGEDTLGFGIYVKTVASFLIHRDTKTPLTMSVEGEWGSGKTSFLLQLQSAVATRKRPTVFFNAWRHDKDESLWAAFALACIKAARRQKSFLGRLRSDAVLTFSRFDFYAAAPDLLKLFVRSALLLLTVCLSYWLVTLPHGQIQSIGPPPNSEALIKTLAGAGGAVGAFLLFMTILRNAKDIVGDPFEVSLRRYVSDPSYKSRVAFVETFHEDFGRVLAAYVDPDKFFVFIDDLDRCDVPRVAELMQAINMLTSTDCPGPVFVLGMDRKIVAASLTARYKPLLEFLKEPNSGDAGSDADADASSNALDYGYAFMDKFVQLPFRVPQARQEYLARLLEPNRVAPRPALRRGPFYGGPLYKRIRSSSDATSTDVQDTSLDSDRAKRVIESAAILLDHNPRRIKQFINVFRLNVRIFLVTNRLQFVPITHDKLPGIAELTLEKLGRFLATILRWPRLVDAFEDDLSLLSRFQKGAIAQQAALSEAARYSGLQNFLSTLSNGSFNEAEWSEDERRLIFSLEAVDVRDLIQMAPTIRASLVAAPTFAVGTNYEGSLSEIAVTGAPALVRSSHAHRTGALELIVPLVTGRLAHFRCEAKSDRPTWFCESVFPFKPDRYNDVALISSSYNGNLEVMARSGSQLRFFYRELTDRAQWEMPYNFVFEAVGPPVLLQSAVHSLNFEMVVPIANAGLKHFWRDNALSSRSWIDELRIADEDDALEPIALYETVAGDLSNLQLFALQEQRIVTMKRINYHWSRVDKFSEAPQVIGRPAMLRDSRDIFDLFFGDVKRGVSHWRLDLATLFATKVEDIAMDVPRVEAVAAVGDRESGYDLVLRSGTDLFHAVKNSTNLAWTTLKIGF